METNTYLSSHDDGNIENLHGPQEVDGGDASHQDVDKGGVYAHERRRQHRLPAIVEDQQPYSERLNGEEQPFSPGTAQKAK